MAAVGDPWLEHSFNGYQGWIRESCGYVDGVVVVGRRGYVFSAEGPIVLGGATPETRALFEGIAATFVPAPAS
jgi:hypothetical protein